MDSKTVNLSGLLLVDKPEGISSFGVIQKIKKILGKHIKLGHTGTLDPFATGLLPIVVGDAAKFSQYLLNAHKAYLVQAKLGIETDTYDKEGDIVATALVTDSHYKNFEAALKQFLGKQSQTPPIFSALKKNGKPLYQYALQGKTVEIAPREIEITHLEIKEYAEDHVSFYCECSKGTYIRSLVHDLGVALGCYAHAQALCRTQVGVFSLKNAISLPDLLEACRKGDWQQYLIPIEDALMHFPAVQLTSVEKQALCYGQLIHLPLELGIGTLVRLKSPEFFGLGLVAAQNCLKPERLCHIPTC